MKKKDCLIGYVRKDWKLRFSNSDLKSFSKVVVPLIWKEKINNRFPNQRLEAEDVQVVIIIKEI